MYEEILAQDLLERLENDPENIEIIDVREKFEYDMIHIRNSKLMPLSEIDKHIPNIDWNKEVVFVCRTWGRSWQVTNAFFELGSYGKNLSWGLKAAHLILKDHIDTKQLDPSYF